MSYQVVARNDIKELEKAVNIFIMLGWKLQGGVAITTTAIGQIIFAQAMILIDGPIKNT
jgi:hypothetical protein